VKITMKASLRARVLLTTCLVVAVALTVMGFAGTVLFRHYLMDRTDAQLQSFASNSARFRSLPAHPPPEPPAQAQARSGDPALPSAFLVEVVSSAGHIERVIRTGLHGEVEDPLPQVPAGDLRSASDAVSTPVTVVSGSHSWRALVLPRPDKQYTVVAVSLDNVLPAVARLTLIDFLAGLVALVLLMVFGFWLVSASLAPLRGIERTAESIAGGDLSRRVPPAPLRTEIGRLSSAFNTMLGQVETAYRARADGEQRAQLSEERMRRFIADASHELRTPLTSIRGFADFYAQRGDEAGKEETKRMMSRIRSEAERMSALVDDLLLLAHLDEQRELALCPVDLSSLAADAVHDFRAVQPGRATGLTAEPEPVVVNVDEARIRQVIGNLLGNAMQHTPAGTPVDVTVRAEGSEAHLAVADHGPGMAQDDAERVFERFYRADPARGRLCQPQDGGPPGNGAGSGAGLGLSIVSALVTAHGGRVHVDADPGMGCVFHVWLPLAKTDAIKETA
jgi:two-component system, OmpR family, sensor kinase